MINVYYAYTLGIFVGGIATFLLGAWLGRKWSVGIGAVVAVAGCLVLIAANTAISALLGRLLSGIGGGFTSSSAPVWQVEVAETRMRGRLVVVQLVANGAGYAVALWAIWWYGLSHKADNVPTLQSELWKLPVSMQLVFEIALLALLPFVPESPRWLMSRGRSDDALKTIGHFKNSPPDSQVVQQAYKQMEVPSKYDNPTPKDYLKRALQTCGCRQRTKQHDKSKCRVAWRMILGTVLQLLTGFGSSLAPDLILRFYFQDLLALTENQIDLVRLAYVSFFVFCSGLGLLTIDRIGRRGTLLFALGALTMKFLATTLLLLAHASHALGIDIGILLVLGAGFSGFLFPVPWLYQAEINAWDKRSAGSAVGTVLQTVGALAYVFIERPRSHAAGFHPAWKFGAALMVFNAVTMLAVFLFYPETPGRSLEWLDQYFVEKPPIIVLKGK